MHQETAKGSLVFKSSWHLSTKHGRVSTLSITERQLIKQEAVNTVFYSLWLDLAGNQTQPYHFRNPEDTVSIRPLIG